MSELITNLTTALFNVFQNEYLTVFIVSLFPMVEVRGAIPIAMSYGIEPYIAYLFCAFTSFLISPILLLALRPILNAMKKTKWFHKLANFIEENFKSKADKIENKIESGTALRKSNLKKALGIYAFVAVPLPLTGVWTGSAIAAFLDLKLIYSLPAILLGNLTAAGIIALLSYWLGDNSYIIIIVLAVFILISIVSLLVSAYIKVRKNKKNAKNNAEVGATEIAPNVEIDSSNEEEKEGSDK